VQALSETIVEQAAHVAEVVDELVTMKEVLKQQRKGEMDSLKDVEMGFAEMRNIIQENDFLREKLEEELSKGKGKGKLKKVREEQAAFERRTEEWRRRMQKSRLITRVLTADWNPDKGEENVDGRKEKERDREEGADGRNEKDKDAADDGETKEKDNEMEKENEDEIVKKTEDGQGSDREKEKVDDQVRIVFFLYDEFVYSIYLILFCLIFFLNQ
jgi:hypothetical protein